ncbi:chondroitinase family protein [Dactylosporangium sp. CA-152071]|uniref:chondroitinase family protein n=1 Tax=Dactylosporangium sp. CA-152071 TaxID=3239933 RepID=UPI003D8F4475
MDVRRSPALSRRRFLYYGAAALSILPAAPGLLPAPAFAVGAELPDLERRALELDPPAFLLETAVPAHITASAGSMLAISDRAAVCGTRSMRWDFAARSDITVRAHLRWERDPYRPTPLSDQAWQGTVDTFSIWIYNETAMDDVVRFKFGRDGRTDAWFDFHLNFTGWRTAWVRYDYDMHGRAHPDMNTLRIVAPRRAGVPSLSTRSTPV